MIDGGGLAWKWMREWVPASLSPAYLFPLVSGQPGGLGLGAPPSAERVRGTRSPSGAQAW